MGTADMLRLTGVRSGYGRASAEVLRGVSLRVARGECVAIVGANGAGKTTLLRTITGLCRVFGGSVECDGCDISSSPTSHIVRLGVSHVPEGRQLFAPMTVKENLILGVYALPRCQHAKQIRDGLQLVHDLFPILAQRTSQTAGTLSGGEQQMLAIGRALMGRPRLLLLDEPTMGLAPMVMEEIFRVVGLLRDMGLTVLVVEQNARLALRTCTRGYVLEDGAVVQEGPSAELAADASVKEAYLGRSYRERAE